MRLVIPIAAFALCYLVLTQAPVISGIALRVPILTILVSAMVAGAASTRAAVFAVRRKKNAEQRRDLERIDSPDARGKLGVLLLDDGRPRQAVEHLVAAREGEPERAEWAYRLGLALNQAGQGASAREQLEAAVELDEEHAYGVAMLALAAARLEDGDAAAALDALARFDRNHGASAESAYRRGRALIATGDREAADAAFSEVAELANSAPAFQRSSARSWARKAWLARTFGR